LLKKIQEYAEIIHFTQTASVTRKTLTAALRQKFRDASEIPLSMGHLILHLRTTAEGKLFAEGWKSARHNRRQGHGPDTDNTPAPPKR
jgi:hypothetical protein